MDPTAPPAAAIPDAGAGEVTPMVQASVPVKREPQHAGGPRLPLPQPAVDATNPGPGPATKSTQATTGGAKASSSMTGDAQDKYSDFRKLEPAALQKYLEHHGLTAKPGATPGDLAAIVGRHFEKEQVDEEHVLHAFIMSGVQAANNLLKLEKKRKRGGPGGTAAAGNTGATPLSGATSLHGVGGGYPPRKETRLTYNHVAKVDEEVAARLQHQGQDDPTTGWILARVVKYVADRDQYHVRDEDDHSNVQTVTAAHVIRLDDNVGDVQKNDTVLAVFPQTTTFYRAQVTKVPKRNAGDQEIVVKFEDDEDETGRTPPRRVPARHVLRLSQLGRTDNTDAYSDGAGSAGGNEKGSRKGMKEYRTMISHALQKLPANKGTLKEIFRIIEEDFRDELCWKLEGEGKKTPVWKNQVRKLLIDPRSGFMFINNGNGDRGILTYTERS